MDRKILCLCFTKQHEVLGRTDHLLFFIRHGEQKINGGDTQKHREQGDIISLLTKIKGDTQRNRQHGDLISPITLKNYLGIHRQRDRRIYR
jgi:hypothetical protein